MAPKAELAHKQNKSDNIALNRGDNKNQENMSQVYIKMLSSTNDN